MNLPVFLSQMAPVHPLAQGAHPSGGGGQPARLGFSMQTQQQTEWCWAATSTSVSVFYNAASPWTQCGVAQACLGLSCCAQPLPSGCNIPGYLDQALTKTGNLAALVGGALPFSGGVGSNIDQEIDAGRPIGCHISWRGGGGHFNAIYGYDPSNQDVDVGDSYYGSLVTVPYSTFCSNYQSAGSYDYSYLTS